MLGCVVEGVVAVVAVVSVAHITAVTGGGGGGGGHREGLAGLFWYGVYIVRMRHKIATVPGADQCRRVHRQHTDTPNSGKSKLWYQAQHLYQVRSRSIYCSADLQRCPGKDYDSDSGNSDHSSSGRGSGGSDLGSELDRDGSRLEDSGRYSADGEEARPPPPAPHAPAPHAPASAPAHPEKTHPDTQPSDRPHQRSAPVTHPPVDAPLCGHCARRNLSFFNPECGGCSVLLRRPSVTAAHVFAVMRQWVPQVQQNIHHFVRQVRGLGASHRHGITALAFGCHVDDRDALTDMTLLHYAVKAGSNGVGDQETALQWRMSCTGGEGAVEGRRRCPPALPVDHMTALHYAAYFDVAPVLHLLLRDPMGVCVNDACLEYSGGTPLHIAAANLCLAAVRVLLHHGALPSLADTQGRTSFQCIPTPEQYELVPDVQDVISCLRGLLSPSASHARTHASHAYPAHSATGQGSSGKAVLKAMGLRTWRPSVGERHQNWHPERVSLNKPLTPMQLMSYYLVYSAVMVGHEYLRGRIRCNVSFVGTTEFSTGLWAGVELETPTGRHNGTVKGVMYFRCAKNYGIFVPMNRLTKIPHMGAGRQGRSSSQAHRHHSGTASRRSVSLPPGRVNHGRVDVSQVASKVALDIRDTTRKIVLGDRVFVDMGLGSGAARVATGTVKFTGAVHFASGFWVGVELNVPRGTNDGAVNGTKYFPCKPHHGIFAAPSRVINFRSYIRRTTNDRTSGCPSDFPMQDARLFLSHSRHSLTSHHGSAHALHLATSGPLSLGYSPAPTTFSTQGPRSLGWGGSVEGASSTANLGPACHDSCCTTCSASQHLLETSGPASLKAPQTLKPAIYPSNTGMTSLNRSFSARYITSRQRQEELERAAEERRQEQVWCDPPILQATPRAQRKKRENQHWLEVGHNVFYKNIVGVIKYIGKVNFEEGVWLGVELRAAKGKHDGAVNGRRYFSCRPRHGVMVKPHNVYVRGINGSKLVKPEDEDEDQ
ncbi:CAP-Gly domain-containing linker protein 3 [Chionoecetes opilio]|uniref:CAP-Gly domain-containing linker protein 3 n=1 Tax=Chionoecetes opilio TaxID=41210 RepID=A0A8J4YRG7_CHIOP|nr:CAP-Gly domain-containing linker protein 3 [Chionoecetes opilio]